MGSVNHLVEMTIFRIHNFSRCNKHHDCFVIVLDSLSISPNLADFIVNLMKELTKPGTKPEVFKLNCGDWTFNKNMTIEVSRLLVK